MSAGPTNAPAAEGPLIQVENGDRRSRGESTYWDIDDVQFHCRIGRSTAWRLVRRDGFPAPVVFSPRGVLWPREEVVAFMELHRNPSHYRCEDHGSPPRRREAAFSSRSSLQRQG